MIHLITLLANYLLFAFFATAVAHFWQYVTSKGQFLSIVTERLLPYLKERNKLFYKALGGCKKCNLMWVAILLVFPIFLWLIYPLSILAKSYKTMGLLWLLFPMVALKMEQMTQSNHHHNHTHDVTLDLGGNEE